MIVIMDVTGNQIELIKWTILKWFTLPFEGVYITKDLTNICVILINHDYYDHLKYDVIEYLCNKNKTRYYDISLNNNRWSKDEIETSEGKHQRDK